MPRLKPFDAEEFIQFHQAKQDPTGGFTIGEIIEKFLNNQKEVGIRQFAERTKIRRHRLQQIIKGADPTIDEVTRITDYFAILDKRYTERAALANDTTQLLTNPP